MPQTEITYSYSTKTGPVSPPRTRDHPSTHITQNAQRGTQNDGIPGKDATVHIRKSQHGRCLLKGSVRGRSPNHHIRHASQEHNQPQPGDGRSCYNPSFPPTPYLMKPTSIADNEQPSCIRGKLSQNRKIRGERLSSTLGVVNGDGHAGAGGQREAHGLVRGEARGGGRGHRWAARGMGGKKKPENITCKSDC